jgi:hypothetical protein
METLCINGTFEVELERDDGVRWIYAVRKNGDSRKDIHFLTFKDAFVYRSDAYENRDAVIVNIKCRLNDADYISARYNSRVVRDDI